MSEAITLSQSKRLIELEAVITRGKQTFTEVAAALAEIRDSRLYKSEYSSFEAYCRQKWGWHKAYCNHLILAAETVKALPEKVATIVANEAQARELAKIPAEKRAKVLESVAARGPVTARAIREEVEPDSEPPRVCTADEIQAERIEAAKAILGPIDAALTAEEEAELHAAEQDAEIPDQLRQLVEHSWHKWCRQWKCEDLPKVRAIVRPFVMRD